MNEWVGSAATIDEAIAEGLKELGATRDEVEIEVLEVPKKRLLGLARSDAKVKLTRKHKAQETNTPPRNRDGKAWIKDGKLGYEPPEEGGNPPRLIIDKRITVRYGGELVQNSVQLTDGLNGLDIILPENMEPVVHIEVSVDKDGLTAHFHWQQNQGIEYRLGEQPPANVIQLRLEQTVLQPKPLTVDDVAVAVQSEGISYGLNLEGLNQEMLSQPKGSVVVAQGQPPIPPKDATVDYVFQKRNQVDLDALRIDYYEAYGISSVEEGAILAVKIPPEPGTPGTDVFGRKIPVGKPKDLQIKCGKGANLSRDGTTATAATSGLPLLRGNIIEVLPVLELKSDADISTGNITFDGAIVIRGSVLENVKVESLSGTVHVGGLVSGAVIRSYGSIVVQRNVVASELQAGGLSIVQMKIAGILHNIRDYLVKLERAFHSVAKHSESISEALLLRHLVDLKFSAMLKSIEELGDLFGEVSYQLSPELHEIVARLMVNFNPQGTRANLSLDAITRLSQMIAEQEEVLSAEAENEADIRARYLQNSRLEAAGSVIIEGQGAHYSTVIAGKGFHMERGLFRGGSITVNQGNIILKELGGPTGVATNATIVTNGRLKCQTVHSNVIISIAQQRYRFDEPAMDVHAYLVDGSLVVHGSGIKLVGD
ncbi:MAG TPA: FapA family protein [Firmicutes bacterium]|nr:FapA family protein [Bacillota bacterium]